ncbi:MAG TPA: polyribonucleotide nucleotidyltransferase [Candidatus Binatia bacterium]|nr:polyribonucleotide nucleotidyltransferase [Candidatus Binatia bacterium]
MRHEVALEVGGRRLVLETGRIAKQAHGAVVVSYSDTVVLVTAVSQDTPREGVDFFPLTIEYQEKAFAAGKIPGGFFKREGRQGADEILTCRCIDRPVRPLFPDGYRNETQIIATVLSADRAGAPDVISLIGSSAALHISDIPFGGPVAGIRVGRHKGKLIANPSVEELEECDINILVAAKRDAIVMVEGGARQVPEDEVLEALYFGHEQIVPIIDMQEELRRLAGRPKRAYTTPVIPEDILNRVREMAEPMLRKAYSNTVKQDRYAALDVVKKEFKALLTPELVERAADVGAAYSRVKEDIVRGDIVAKGHRVDGRDLDTVRPITIETGILPRTHGSTLFTRGETQAIVVATLGTSADEQRIDALLGDYKKRFMLHYNFPPYSVGEAKMLRGAGRREIGHGALAERAVSAVLPDPGEFPYTLRVVSEITESNGSSSMASVCGASLALMDAGVPIKAAVAGVAMGLIAEEGKFFVLTDILGDEDHLGDMDFKIAGTEKGITAVQMDIKVDGLPREVMRDAVHKARTARLHILGEMTKALQAPREEMSIHAPRIETVKIHPDKIRDLIGPGGKVIRGIVDQTGCKIDVSDDGTVLVASSDGEAMKRALDIIHGITASPEVGRIYHGTVRRITDFGAFVEILPGTDGLLHISQLEDRRVESVRDVLKEGDKIPVKVLEVDRQGKIRLSLKEARREMAEPGQGTEDDA